MYLKKNKILLQYYKLRYTRKQLVSVHPRANARRIGTLNDLCKRLTMAYDRTVPGTTYDTSNQRNFTIKKRTTMHH